MSYLSIQNLYKAQDILMMRECFALEKLHGSSAHIRFAEQGNVTLFSGGAKHEEFVKLFDEVVLQRIFTELFGIGTAVVVYGEAYGGKMMSMSATYGKVLKFVAFEVQVGKCWLAVPQAEDVVTKLGLEFVHYTRIPTDLSAIDAERDADSVQAVRNGMGVGKMREGIVLRPLIELTKNNGGRIIAKHKRPEFAEMLKPPKVVDPSQIEVLREAGAIANQWVTAMRQEHVLQDLPHCTGMEHTPEIIRAMIADIKREAAGEIMESKEVWKAISKKAVDMWKTKVQAIRAKAKTGGAKGASNSSI